MSTPPQPEQLAPARLFPPQATHAHTILRRGRRTKTVYRAHGAEVGVLYWNRWGRHPRLILTPRWQLEYHDGGTLSLAVPLHNGLMHGDTAQWTPDGALLVSCRFVHGTGIDLLCCSTSGRLLEAHPYRGGQLHGWERWWDRPRTVSEEIHWADGRRHGPHRTWRGGQLTTRLFVGGLPVSRAAYLRAARSHPALPALRDADEQPQRAVPRGFVRRVFRHPPWEE